jgi:hypothetical protein
MGFYLNSKKPYLLFREDRLARYFVDKSKLLNDLIPVVEWIDNVAIKSNSALGKELKYICITRPRRFGKTMAANMISAYFGKGADSGDIFRGLEAASYPWFTKHLNQHHVIHIMFNEIPDECTTYMQYITRFKKRLLADLMRAFPEAQIDEDCALWDAFNNIIEFGTGDKFIFILDEWDFIFHRDFVTEKDKAAYITFLSNLFKDQPYVELVYMTGILPIAKYSSGSELNMFCEYTMTTEERFTQYFGFIETEVDKLFEQYQKCIKEGEKITQKVTREGLRDWYNGYHTKSGERVYNPCSVVLALTNNNLGNYWTSSGPYDEIKYYIEKNTDVVRDELAMLVSGTPVSAKVREYAATSMNLTTKDEIFSAMVVYGFLNYKDGFVSIPNKELMNQFADMLCKEPSLGYVYRLAKESERMLAATKALDTDTMVSILEFAHNSESPILNYNNETELTMIVNMVYLSARDSYRIEREDKAGVGFVDFIFYPYRAGDDCIILELKAGHTAQDALKQIKDRGYAMKFQGKLGEKPQFTGRILLVGIAYNKGKDKKHSCKIEVFKKEMGLSQ